MATLFWRVELLSDAAIYRTLLVLSFLICMIDRTRSDEV